MPSRFDYVAYDETAVELQKKFKSMVEIMESKIKSVGAMPTVKDWRPGFPPNPAISSLIDNKMKAIEKLEECYMWIGKAIRDDQIARNGSAPLQEGRTDS